MTYQVRTIFWHNRWSGAVSHVSNRRKGSNLRKRRQNILCFGVWKHTLFWGVKTHSVLGCENTLCFGVCGRKNFFTLSPSYKQSPKNREKSLCPTVLQLRWVISTLWDENMTLFVFLACYEIHWNWFCGRKQTENGEFFWRRVLW